MVTKFLLHNLTLPAEEETGYIGVWGQHRLNFKAPSQSFVLQSAHFWQTPFPPCRYRRTNPTPFFRLVNELAEKENVSKELKSDDILLWVQKINNIRDRATEIVNNKLIYS